MPPKVECIHNSRYRYFFYSNDHEPPHVHVRRDGEWEIRVKFLSCTENFLDYNFKTPSKRKTSTHPLKRSEQDEILADILASKDKLYEEWCRKVNKD